MSWNQPYDNNNKEFSMKKIYPLIECDMYISSTCPWGLNYSDRRGVPTNCGQLICSKC